MAHWIGREVKRFIDEAHLHLPFLLQVAAAPADCIPEMEQFTNDDGDQEMDLDDEYAPTDAEIQHEEEEEPLMLNNAERWDRFLDLVRQLQKAWPQGELDTDDFRKGRALAMFNLAVPVVRDLLELKPTMLTWVPHILLYIVTRQMVFLGDPVRRSCDACESFGAMLKKIIKHATCRRRVTTGQFDHGKKATAGTTARRWKQTFKVGYIEQAFKRACVRESLQHGAENADYLQRADVRRKTAGKASTYTKFVDPALAPVQPKSIHTLSTELAAEDTN